ncbi:MAG: hypothetical protein MJZ74_07795 [Muribaculaceae bacterium]|nr:hypothetical protein [Muribaculaceae bacterium]
MFFNKNNNDPNSYSIKQELDEFFKQNNVDARVSHDDGDKSTDYYFEYQKGNFVANVRDNDRFVQVTFPSFYDVNVEHLELVRLACNYYNGGVSVFKFTYSTSEDKTKLNLHISFIADRANTEEFVNRLSGCFYYQRRFIDYVDAGIKDANSDVELESIKGARRAFLINQQEISHQPGEEHIYRTTDIQRFTLEQLLFTAMGMDDIEFKQLALSTAQGTQVITDAGQIADTDLVHAMVNEDATGYQAPCVNATLEYADPGQPKETLYLALAVTPSGCDDTSCYVRVSLTLVPSPTSRANAHNRIIGSSVVIAVDRESPEKKIEEFNYMWEDAIIKSRNKEKLTDDQEFLSMIASPSTGYNFYWGMRHFYQGRYYEALLHLENVFKDLRADSMVNGGNGGRFHDLFEDLCFHLGFCCNELCNFDKAFFYLEIVRTSPRIQVIQEFINTLANSKDVRVLSTIDYYLGSVQHSINENKDEEVPEHVQAFMEFLLRRKGYALIDVGQLDEAEETFKALLNSPGSHDYAVNELAYLQRLRRSQQQDKEQDPDAEDKAGDTAAE